ncbi:MAG: hypothetical protein Q4G69_03675 [Planctomycetia bacterium]|nr:hypothetical protein [Planctomycetia bacterium]
MRKFIKNYRIPFFFTAALLTGLAGCLLTVFLCLQVPESRLKIPNENKSIRVYPVGSSDYDRCLLSERNRAGLDSAYWTKEIMNAMELQLLAGFPAKKSTNDSILSVLNDLEEKTSSDLNSVRDFLNNFSEQDLAERDLLPILIPLNAPPLFMEQGGLSGSFAKNPLNRIRFCSKEEIILDFPPEIRLLKSVSPICLGSSFFFLFCSLGICSPRFHLFSSFNDPVLYWILFLNDLQKKIFSDFGRKTVPIFSVCSYWERLFLLPAAPLEATKTTVLLR